MIATTAGGDADSSFRLHATIAAAAAMARMTPTRMVRFALRPFPFVPSRTDARARMRERSSGRGSMGANAARSCCSNSMILSSALLTHPVDGATQMAFHCVDRHVEHGCNIGWIQILLEAQQHH